ncbi:MAG: DUF2231 domain-containing protein [Terriglobales bacterium]
MNPFDPRTALLAKHAQHVVLVHFPIALFLTGVAFDFAARWAGKDTKRTTLAAAARLNILAAAIFVLPTLATGIAAWQWQLAGHKLKGILLLHVALGSASGFLICLVAWIHSRRGGVSGSALPAYYLPLEGLTVVVVALTAHIGGFVSGVNLPV